MRAILKHTTKSLFIVIYFFGSCEGPKKTAHASDAQNQQINSYSLSSDDDLDVLIREIGKARIVLLGEASHGTAEYYNWRAAISKKLITEKGFNLLAVEGDHIDLYRLNRCIKGEPGDTDIIRVLSAFDRWPQWLWGNEEFAGFAQWIKNRNVGLVDEKKVNVCGLDVFNFAAALKQLLTVLDDSIALHHAKRAQDCLKPFGGDALRYSTAVSKGSFACKEEVYSLWQAVQKIAGKRIDNEKELSLIQHALVVLDGEQYFRLRNTDAADSWNARVRHMQEMIRRLLQ
ncbi:MAG TPA: erythromycin esterase family protein, partial [Flavisolibacter sp.]|nr:erythromycin esterase family protein [Flavisolibacter sp.]